MQHPAPDDAALLVVHRLRAAGERACAHAAAPAPDAPLAPPAPAAAPGPDLGGQALRGAGRAALVGGAISAARHAGAVARGEEGAERAAVEVAIDAAASAASGALLAVVAGLTRAAGLSRASVPVALALTAAGVGRDAWERAQGRLTDRELQERAVAHALRGGCVLVGIEAGALLGGLALPGAGAALGAVVGGVAGSRLGEHLTAPDEPPDGEPGQP